MDALERDFYEERRRKWRRSAFFRGFGIAIALVVGLVALLLFVGGGPRGPHIAHVPIWGVIYNDADLNDLLLEIRDNPDVRAVYLDIDSPGGTTVGAEAVFELVRKIGENRPVVAVMGDVAASGGYIAAASADHIIARGNTLTGSIGVIMEYPNLTGLLDTIGVEFETVRSSPLKAEPSPYRPPSDGGTAVQEAIIADSYEWFRTLVADRRGLEGPELDRVTDGRVFTGRMALEAGLVDQIGGSDEAFAYLESVDVTLADLPVETWTPYREEPGLFSIFGQLSEIERSFGRFSRNFSPRLMSQFN